MKSIVEHLVSHNIRTNYYLYLTRSIELKTGLLGSGHESDSSFEPNEDELESDSLEAYRKTTGIIQPMVPHFSDTESLSNFLDPIQEQSSLGKSIELCPRPLKRHKSEHITNEKIMMQLKENQREIKLLKKCVIDYENNEAKAMIKLIEIIRKNK